MNCSPLLVIKKRNLHRDTGRPQNPLYFELGGGGSPEQRSPARRCGSSTQGQMVFLQWLWYHFGRYAVSEGKADTYSVEADNAELRHYLARLARRSRCFSRCPYALECALRLFVFCFNSRQLHKQLFPNYPAHVMDFVSPLF